MALINVSQSTWIDSSEYASVSQADTLTSPAAHFWDMHETGSPSALTDIIAGATITTSDLTPQGGGVYVRASASIETGQVLTGGVAMGSSDFMLMSVAKSVGTGNDNGHTGFYWELTGAFQFKTHPYYAMAGGVRTLPYTKNLVRTIGEIYTHALVKRGQLIEHYCLPRGFIDSFNLSSHVLMDSHSDIIAPTIADLGHGGYGTPYNNGVGRVVGGAPWDNNGDVAQDYAGIAVYKFSNGAPPMSEIVKCLRWCEQEWTENATGKRLYPGFI